ncbi:GNAT family N-acetyltransferase [Actinospica robiniae]|uniref:GNAT family N-acetyltransferase n=1 Tax=Actinospica robiniae TaxID=304901 RepID=UPI0003FB5CF7|nr:GNAT family N-acetyltransferase [Actinospica robiniae]
MITLAPARPEDAADLVGLMNELERFYGGEPGELFEEQVGQIGDALFSNSPAGHVVLARDGNNAAGFASYSFLWPAAGFTRSLYLKELYVAEKYRRRGVGRLLMDELHELAREHQCSRVEWTTDTPNDGARRFYEHLGYAEGAASKILYRSTL